MTNHTHPTRNIFPFGECPRCDEYWKRQFAAMADAIKDLAEGYGFRAHVNSNGRTVKVYPAPSDTGDTMASHGTADSLETEEAEPPR